jgi:hypothetical protein
LAGKFWREKFSRRISSSSCGSARVTQGDQIGRIFAYWAIVLFGHLKKVTEEVQNFGLLFSRVVVFGLFF